MLGQWHKDLLLENSVCVAFLIFYKSLPGTWDLWCKNEWRYGRRIHLLAIACALKNNQPLSDVHFVELPGLSNQINCKHHSPSVPLTISYHLQLLRFWKYELERGEYFWISCLQLVSVVLLLRSCVPWLLWSKLDVHIFNRLQMHSDLGFEYQN